MSFANDPIKVSGLREFQAALKAMDGESQKQLKVVLDGVATTVASGAARRVPRKTGRAAASVRARSSQREARVMGGSKKVPYYGWLDFGGRIGKDKSVKRPFVEGGRYIYPAYAAQRDSVQRALEQGLADLVRAVGMEVDNGG